MPTLTPRTRLDVFLPVNNPAEMSAAVRVREALVQRFGGATQSSLQSPVFRGYWVAPDGELYVDEIAIATVDVDQDINDTRLQEGLDSLRGAMFAAYARAGSTQQEVWLTAHPLFGIG